MKRTAITIQSLSPNKAGKILRQENSNASSFAPKQLATRANTDPDNDQHHFSCKSKREAEESNHNHASTILCKTQTSAHTCKHKHPKQFLIAVQPAWSNPPNEKPRFFQTFFPPQGQTVYRSVNHTTYRQTNSPGSFSISPH